MAPGVPLVCPVLIGRTSGIESLSQKVDEVCDGRGTTVLVSGDAGVGKSRLVLEGVNRAITRRRGSERAPAMLVGRCFEPDRLVPYAAVLDLLHTLFSAHAGGPQACFSGTEAIELSALLPRRFQQIGQSETRSSSIESQPRLFFYNMLDFLECLTAKQPLVVVVEDLHWSDDASLQFLHYLARRLRSGSSPLLLILSYRTDQVHDGLHHFLAALDRDRLATEISVAPLSREEVGEMAPALLAQRPVTERFITRLHALTEGNPSLVEEVIAGIVAGSSATSGATLDEADLDRFRIPRSVYEAVSERERRLTPGARKLLRLAAVAGRRFDFSLLRRLSPAGSKLLPLIRELVDAQLVIEENTETFAFRHALAREAVLSRMLHLEKQGMHRAIAETIERSPDLLLETRLPELAHHYYFAGVWRKAREYSLQAAEEAGRLSAPSAAAEHLTRAIEATRALGEEPAADVLRMRELAYQAAGETIKETRDRDGAPRLARSDERLTARDAEKQRFDGLTAREKDVAALVARGYSNKTIASTLVVAERTVESHVSSILSKLGFGSRSQIAAWAVEKGLLKGNSGKPNTRPETG